MKKVAIEFSSEGLAKKNIWQANCVNYIIDRLDAVEFYNKKFKNEIYKMLTSLDIYKDFSVIADKFVEYTNQEDVGRCSVEIMGAFKRLNKRSFSTWLKITEELRIQVLKKDPVLIRENLSYAIGYIIMNRVYLANFEEVLTYYWSQYINVTLGELNFNKISIQVILDSTVVNLNRTKEQARKEFASELLHISDRSEFNRIIYAHQIFCKIVGRD